MILRRFYEDKLAQASFLVGCTAAREAVVIDPNRDLEQYVQAAERERVKITAVTETHIHADYLSGSRELAARTGARLYVSDEGGDGWRYAFRDEPNVVALRDGAEIRAGAVRLRAIHTPGHTPEHLCFELTDTAATDEPMGVFTGDFIFAGDVGRPDLLEKVAGVAGAMDASAQALFRSLRAFERRPGHLLLWPGHGAGSPCGKALGGVPVTTLAYEKLVNSALRETDEARFVADILAGQPDPPRYFAEMKRLNRDGPPPLALRLPPRLDPDAALDVLEGGAVMVDLRRADEFARAFAPGLVNIPSGGGFLRWAGRLLPYDRALYLLAGHESEVVAAVRDLALIGLEGVRGWALTATVLLGWANRHGDPESVVRVTFADAMRRVREDGAVVLDVRDRDEWRAGHVPGAIHVPVADLATRAPGIPQDRPVAVHCQGGGRSSLAVSLLRRLGFVHVAEIPGGFPEYRELGLPVETGAADDLVSA